METKLEQFNRLKAAMVVLGLSLELYAAVQAVSLPSEASADQLSATFDHDLAVLMSDTRHK